MGWIYKQSTGKIHANTKNGEKDDAGVKYKDYLPVLGASFFTGPVRERAKRFVISGMGNFWRFFIFDSNLSS